MYQASGAGSNDFRRHNSSQSSSQLPVDPEQGKPPTMRTGRSNNPQTGRIGQLALMHMKQPSALTSVTKVNTSQVIPTYG